MGYGSDTITFTEPMTDVKISVANDTYPALSMKDGDAFSKKFGGDSSDDPDWFKLTINAINNAGSKIWLKNGGYTRRLCNPLFLLAQKWWQSK